MPVTPFHAHSCTCCGVHCPLSCQSACAFLYCIMCVIVFPCVLPCVVWVCGLDSNGLGSLFSVTGVPFLISSVNSLCNYRFFSVELLLVSWVWLIRTVSNVSQQLLYSLQTVCCPTTFHIINVSRLKLLAKSGQLKLLTASRISWRRPSLQILH